VKKLADRVLDFLRPRFDGQVASWPYDLFRICMGLLVLVRTTDVLRPYFDLDHHAWVQGLEYHPEVEKVSTPALSSPLLPGFGLSAATELVLVRARSILALTLLLGLRTRLSAVLLALVGALLLLADRYRYLHHVQLMWMSVAWIALMPGPSRLSLDRWFGAARAAHFFPRWPLQLLRIQGACVYLAAGIAKLSTDWLSGATLRGLTEVRMVGGGLWELGVSTLGFSGLAIATATFELGLPLLLVFRRTRVFGIVLGVIFHLTISQTMVVATFTPQMILYLFLFLPFEQREGATELSKSAR